MRTIIKTLGALLTALALMLSPILAWITPAPAIADYEVAPIVVTNNTTAFVNQPVYATVNNTYLAANGFMNSSANDTLVTTSAGAVLPWMVADNATWFVADLQSHGTTNFNYSMGNTPSAATMSIITGTGGYVTVADTAALRPGSVFSFPYYGYVDTGLGAGKNLIYKSGSMRVYTGIAANTVTAEVTGATGYTQTLLTAGIGDLTGLAMVGAATNWQATNTADGYTSYVTRGTEDLYLMQPGTIPAYAIITNVSECAVAWQSGVGATITFHVKLGGVDSAVGPVGIGGSYGTISASIARPGGGSWVPADIPNIQAGLAITNGTGAGLCTQVYIFVTYSYPVSTVSVGSVISGYHTVTTSAAGGVLTLVVDAATNSVPLYNAVPVNANPWLIGQNNVSSYIASYKEFVGGVEVLSLAPISITNGTTLVDSAGTQNGTISWGALPANVYVSIGGLGPLGTSTGSGTPTTPTDILGNTGTTNMTGGSTDTVGLAAHPLYPVVSAIATLTSFTEGQVWMILGLIIVVVLLVVSLIIVPAHLAVAGSVVMVADAYLVSQTIWPWWTLIIFSLAWIASLISERTPYV